MMLSFIKSIEYDNIEDRADIDTNNPNTILITDTELELNVDKFDIVANGIESLRDCVEEISSRIDISTNLEGCTKIAITISDREIQKNTITVNSLISYLIRVSQDKRLFLAIQINECTLIRSVRNRVSYITGTIEYMDLDNSDSSINKTGHSHALLDRRTGNIITYRRI